MDLLPVAIVCIHRHYLLIPPLPLASSSCSLANKVRMGFGLHAGWAIEGAVGSLQKVDATYLSPHVNMAARLETSSRQYGVPVLMSEKFYELMSDEGKELCRRVDRVTVKGSEMPIDIYTYDALQDQEWKPEKGIEMSANTLACHRAIVSFDLLVFLVTTLLPYCPTDYYSRYYYIM